MSAVHTIGKILFMAALMFWQMLWALVLGFFLSGMTQAFISKKRMSALLGKAGLRELGLAAFFGAASSSCSYAAAAMARSLFKKGAHIVSALAFMIASTNLVVELGLVLWTLMGWQFVVAEFLGGLALIGLFAILMRLIGPVREFERLRHQSSDSKKDSSCCHHEHSSERTANIRSREGWKKAAQAFVMDWRMIWKDIALGVVISAVIMVLVPDSFWRALFLQSGAGRVSFWVMLENAFVGPLVSVVSFVCSVGNIPVASALFHHGISFGGAISFIYADLIVIPLILIYRKYYGTKLALWISAVMYLAMSLTGLAIELVFTALDWIPKRSEATAMHHRLFFEINYTFWLNLAAAALAAFLVWLSRNRNENRTDSAHEMHHS